MKTFQRLMCLSLIAVLAVSGVADEPKKGKGKRERKAPSVTSRFVGKIDLNEEQKQKLAEIDKQFAGRFKELSEKRREILTPEQREAQAAAAKAAREARAAGKEVEKKAAPQLSEEQKKKQKELLGVQQALNKEVLAALKKVLTDEQIEKLPKRGGGRAGAAGKKPKGDGPKGEKGKKKKAAEEEAK